MHPKCLKKKKKKADYQDFMRHDNRSKIGF